ncbi:MAG: polymer-forming cytoskeletal protein [Candidatus Binataceae bacterium]|nr:polymer-forming cytoskeletal protein [Candidatus Binataceae bacterium]
MALFSKEADKSAKSVQPQQPWQDKPGPAMATTISPVVEEKAAPKMVHSTPAAAEGRAYLDKGSRVSGKLSFEGAARLDGQVDGEINAKDSLTIGETAVVTAQINAGSVIVAGRVSGDITATQRLEIRPSARVVGNLAAPILVIHEGASFEGHCTMQPEGARDERKVTVFPKEDRLSKEASSAGGRS